MTIPHTEGNNKLAPFLRDLADKMDSNSLTIDQLQQVGEFYMSYKVLNEPTEEELNTLDFIKFMTLGLYIYKFILDQDNNSEVDYESVD